MRIHLDCVPCFVRQTLSTARTQNLDDETSEELLRQVLGLLEQMDWALPPPVIGRDIHRMIRTMLDDLDPYLHAKISDTETALKLLPEIEKAVTRFEDPFEAAVKFSIAGNAIDLGAKSEIDVDVEKSFRGALSQSIDRYALSRLKLAISEARSVLFLADNAGEIVFDRPLLNYIGKDKVTIAVRGFPVINDACMDDAIRSGLVDQFRVISNGSDTPGTYLPDCSKLFVRQFESADLVISKGQGNYESLNDHERKMFFLFLTKCLLVSKTIRLPMNTYVIKENEESPTIEQTVIHDNIGRWFYNYVDQFQHGNEDSRLNVGIKTKHSLRVGAEIAGLAKSLCLEPEEVIFSKSLALLHDVGRFEQYSRYKTFSDKKSVNHAQLGIQILKENRVLDSFDPAERELFYRCIGNHNCLVVSKHETEQCFLYSNLLRDADKLDIWRVITEYYADSDHPRNPTLECDLPESNAISDEVYDTVLTCRTLDTRILHTSADCKVLQMSWIFDVNFPRTFQLVDERKYLEKLANSLPRSTRVDTIFQCVRNFLDAQL